MFFLVEKLKKTTKEAHNNYVINLHKTQIKEKEFNYLASDVIVFIKKFMGNHKVNLDVDSLIQYLNQEKYNFYELMISFLNTIGIFNDNIIESIEVIFKEKYINLVDGLNEENKSSNEININSNDDESSSEESYEKNIILNDSENETNKVNIYIKLNKEKTFILDWDELIIEKINKKIEKKK